MSVVVCFSLFRLHLQVSLKYFNYKAHCHNIISVNKLQVAVFLDSKKQTVNCTTTDKFSLLLRWSRIFGHFYSTAITLDEMFPKKNPLIEWVFFVAFLCCRSTDNETLFNSYTFNIENIYTKRICYMQETLHLPVYSIMVK